MGLYGKNFQSLNYHRKFMQQRTIVIPVVPFFVVSVLVNCLNDLYVTNDPRDYGWKEDDGKFIPVWFEGDALPNTRRS